MEATEPKTLEQMAEGLLMPEPDEAPDEDQTELDEGTDDEEPLEAEADDDTDEADDEADADDDDDDENDEETEVDEQPQTFKVKVDGEEREVTLEELTRGYAGQSYIQKGMKETADLRRQTEETYNALNQQRQQLHHLVQNLQQTGMRPPVAPDIAMLNQDPIGYMEAKAKYDNDQSQYGQKVQAFQQHMAQAQQAEQQAQQAYLNEQKQLLSQRIPEFTDPQKGAALQQRLVSTGGEYGFDETELAGITDARAVQVLHDAMRYREIVGKKEAVTAKAAKARPVVKSGAKNSKAPAKVQREKARQKLRQTGRAEDAIDLMFDT